MGDFINTFKRFREVLYEYPFGLFFSSRRDAARYATILTLVEQDPEKPSNDIMKRFLNIFTFIESRRMNPKEHGGLQLDLKLAEMFFAKYLLIEGGNEE